MSTDEQPDGTEPMSESIECDVQATHVNVPNTSSQQRLRDALSAVDLTPEQTSDDIVRPTSRDAEIRRDVPPHHVDH